MRLFLIAIIIFLWSACTKKQSPFLRYTSEAIHHKLPDSLKASIDLSFATETESGSLSGTLFSVPGERYRIELRGPLGISAASIFWKDSNWSIIIPSEELIWKGRGRDLPTPIPGLKSINIHQLVSTLWGDILGPGWEDSGKENKDSLTHWSWQKENIFYTATMNQKTGHIYNHSQQKQSERLDITLQDYQEHPPYVIPTEVTFAIGRTSLTLEISQVNYKPSWKPRLWKLREPASFQTIDWD
jgi:hypothetical protein